MKKLGNKFSSKVSRFKLTSSAIIRIGKVTSTRITLPENCVFAFTRNSDKNFLNLKMLSPKSESYMLSISEVKNLFASYEDKIFPQEI